MLYREELVGKEESLNEVGDPLSRKQKEDKSKADDVRQEVFERYSETKKLKSTEKMMLIDCLTATTTNKSSCSVGYPKAS